MDSRSLIWHSILLFTLISINLCGISLMTMPLSGPEYFLVVHVSEIPSHFDVWRPDTYLMCIEATDQ